MSKQESHFMQRLVTSVMSKHFFDKINARTCGKIHKEICKCINVCPGTDSISIEISHPEVGVMRCRIGMSLHKTSGTS